MKIKSLLMTFIAVIIVGSVYTNTSFSFSLMDPFYEPSLEDTPKERNPVHLKIPENMRIILIVNDLFPWEISNFVHICKIIHGGWRCSSDGHTKFISVTFVDMNNATTINEHNIVTINKIAEIRFDPETGKATELILKTGNISRTIGPKIVRI